MNTNTEATMPDSTKIVAFLQNQWFNNPERVRQILANPRYGKNAHEWREYHVAAFLFMGCLTGKRLRAALGEEWTGRIVWEEVSREIGGKSSSVFPADLEHMRDVIARHQPTCIIGFGSIAREALRSIGFDGILLFAPHPAARSPDVMDQLREIRFKLDHEAE